MCRNLALTALVFLAGCDRFKPRGAEPVTLATESPANPAPADALTERYVSPHKLITARYPRDFAASIAGKNGIVLSRNLPNGTDEAISLLAIEHPISTDNTEFARIVHNASISKLNAYQALTTTETRCNGQPGIEYTGTWKDSAGGTLFRRSCAFVRKGHGYYYGYSVPQAAAASHLALLQGIVAATEFDD